MIRSGVKTPTGLTHEFRVSDLVFSGLFKSGKQ